MRIRSTWLHALAVMLLCVLMSTPGAIRGRVCLMDLGILERQGCCQPTPCCDALGSPEGTARSLDAGQDDCRCCLDLNLEGSGPIVAAASAPGTQDLGSASASLPPSSILLPRTPRSAERSKTIAARGLERPRMPAPVPLGI